MVCVSKSVSRSSLSHILRVGVRVHIVDSVYMSVIECLGMFVSADCVYAGGVCFCTKQRVSVSCKASLS